MVTAVIEGGGILRRFSGFAVVALTLTALLAGPASAQMGAPGFDIKENRARVKADGPGFKVKLSRHDIRTRIDEERFGIPEAGFPIERMQQAVVPQLRPIVCENGTYRFVSGIFEVTERASSNEPRPLPYTPASPSASRTSSHSWARWTPWLRTRPVSSSGSSCRIWRTR